jgi:hypothetical protein
VLHSQLDPLFRALSFTRGGQPSVIFDLDGTLYDNRPRTVEILRRAAKKLPPSSLDSARLLQLKPSHFQYSIRDALVAAHVDDLEWALSAWVAGFFCNDFLSFDAPYPGAVNLVCELHAREAQIVYLSGRDEPLMGAGTRQSLRDWGFPLDVPRTSVILKPDARLDDVAWKSDVIASQFGAGASVLAAFDNEPANCNSFVHHCPNALVYLVDTGHTPNAPAPDPRVIPMTEFVACSAMGAVSA